MELAQVAQVGWTAAQTAVVLVAAIAIVGSIVTASVTYALNQRAARRERQAKVFADALNAVEDYAEMPYRIRRRRDTAGTRYDLTDEVSKIQSRLAYHQALLQIEAPVVADSYARLVRAAKIQAGGQMREAWRQPVLSTDVDMNLGERYPRNKIDEARGACINAMRSALGSARAGRNAPPLPTANSDTTAHHSSEEPDTEGPSQRDQRQQL